MTTPTGKLMWGQAGAYDGIDDRAVIRAVTGGRTGMATAAVVTPASGLQMTVKGGWLALVDCGDGTTAVVGSRTDQVVTGLAGPGSGSRVDYIWADVQPDLATWTLSVINASAAAGRTGVAVATLTVPANATLASQFTIAATAIGATEQRLLASVGTTDTGVRTATTWAAATTVITAPATVQPNHYYRVRLITDSLMPLGAAAVAMRGGIGYRVAGAADTTSVLYRSATLAGTVNQPSLLAVEYVFRHPPGSAAVARSFDGRFWVGGGSFQVCGRTDGGAALTMSIEDLGQ